MDFANLTLIIYATQMKDNVPGVYSLNSKVLVSKY